MPSPDIFLLCVTFESSCLSHVNLHQSTYVASTYTECLNYTWCLAGSKSFKGLLFALCGSHPIYQRSQRCAIFVQGVSVSGYLDAYARARLPLTKFGEQVMQMMHSFPRVAKVRVDIGVTLQETILDPQAKSDMSYHMARYRIVSQDRAVKKGNHNGLIGPFGVKGVDVSPTRCSQRRT